MKISFAIKVTTHIVLITCLLSCKKALKEYNPSQNTAEAVYTTGPGYETLVNAAYSYNRNWYGKEEGFGLSEMGTDLWTGGDQSFSATSGLALDNRALITYQNLTSVNGNVTRVWKALYAGVNLCNLGIKISTDGSFTPSPVRVGELKFLRAFYYWHIVETWGGVHFTTEPTTTAITTANLTPVATFYDQIMQDLNDAIAALPVNSTEYGRVNKMVARAFLARVYLTKGYKDPAYFSLAKAQADSVINSGKYSLLPKYLDLWKMPNQKNAELIWAINYGTDISVSDVYNSLTNPNGYGSDILSASGNPTNDRGNNNSHVYFIPFYESSYDSATYSKGTYGFDKVGKAMLVRDVRNGRGFRRFAPTKYLMDVFDETMDSRYLGSFQTVWKVNSATLAGSRSFGKIPRVDTALVVTKNPVAPNPVKKYYYYNIYDMYDPITHASKNVSNNYLWPTLWKFQDSTRSASPNDLGNGNIQSERDANVMRFAEMYLIAAEACVQNGDPATAANYINVIRARAALPGKAVAMTVTAGQMTLDFILDEKAREFAGEMTRWFDLKRTGQLTNRITLYNPDIVVNYKACNDVRPIPQQQIDAVTNKGEFNQISTCY
jgi:hypothetical protein